MHTDRWLDVVFGMGDDDFPYWLMAVRSNILLFLFCLAAVGLWRIGRAGRGQCRAADFAVVVGLTGLAAALRFLVASANLADLGGIPYSRLLLGYRGYFATAQFYSIFYEWTARDIEHGILLNRIAGTLTIPIVYGFCALWQDRRSHFPAIAALLFATSPLHVLFSATDSLAIFSVFLTGLSYLLLLGAATTGNPALQFLHYLGGLSGLVLSTQVRYENALFLVPAVPYLVLRTGYNSLAPLRAATVVPAALLVFYLWQSATAGLSFRSPVDLDVAPWIVGRQLIRNPFAGLALWGIAGLFAAIAAGWRWGWSVVLVWSVALGLTLIPGESGHGAARGFTSWLLWIVPISAFGIARALEVRWQVVRGVAGVLLFLLVVQPLLFASVFGRTHLEILEHRYFIESVRGLPTEITAIVVPDDEMLRRQAGSTLELFNKYWMALVGARRSAGALKLVRLTDFLERPRATACVPGECAFFFGLPCTPQAVYPFTRNQCMALRESRPLSPLSERTFTGAPFVACSIYAGRLEAKLCIPASTPRTFGMYGIEAVEPRPQ